MVRATKRMPPGSPKRSRTVNPNTDTRFSKARVAWVDLYTTKLLLFLYPDKTEEPDQPVERETFSSPSVRVMLPDTNNHRKSRGFSLTSLTTEELHKVREFFNLACDLAEPIVAFRDKVAQHESERGDNSFTRLYRTIPELFIREGARPADIASLRSRLEDIAEGLGNRRDADGGTSGDGVELAAEEPQDSDAQDDGPESNES